MITISIGVIKHLNHGKWNDIGVILLFLFPSIEFLNRLEMSLVVSFPLINQIIYRSHSKMGLSFIFILCFLILRYTQASETVVQYDTVLKGELFTVKCKSFGQIAVWSWYGKSSVVGNILATGASKHKRFKDER